MDKKTSALMAFLAGVIVGMNWPKISKHLNPYMQELGKKSTDGYNNLLRFFAEQKERIEDTVAEAKVKKTKAKAKGGAKAKGAGQKVKTGQSGAGQKAKTGQSGARKKAKTGQSGARKKVKTGQSK